LKIIFKALLAAAFLMSCQFNYLTKCHSAVTLQEITVREGDTLWGIARRYLKDPKRWPEIRKYNIGLTTDPTVALPGMKLKIPVILIKEKLQAVKITYLLNDVRYRRKNETFWNQAQLQMQLYDDDDLRTFEKSKAHAKFPTGEVIKLDANSLVTLHPSKAPEELILLSGAIRANNAKVITESGSEIVPKTKGTDYLARIKPNMSELVLVYKGMVDVKAHGKTVSVPEGYGSEVKPFHSPSNPIPLPEIPKLIHDSPRDVDLAIEYTLKPGNSVVSFKKPTLTAKKRTLDVKDARKVASPKDKVKTQSIAAKELIKRYRLQISQDPNNFDDPIIDKIFPLSTKFNLNKQGLSDGKYFWRVSYIDALGMEGKFSKTYEFLIDTTAPELEVLKPEDRYDTRAEIITVVGKTEPKATLTVDGKPIITDNGIFNTKVYLKLGKNIIEIIATDPDGNQSKIERTVYKITKSGKKPSEVVKLETEERKRKQERTTFSSFLLNLLSLAVFAGIISLIL